MENLDIIDAHDNKIGVALRDEAHKKQLLHRGICVLVFDTEGKIFVQKRSPKKDIFPGLFECSVNGHVLSGEQYHQAAVRELREELGAITTPAKVREIAQFGFQEQNERMLVKLYVLKDFHGTLTQEREELSAGEFRTLKKLQDELKKNPGRFHPIAKKALELFSKVDGNPLAFLPVKRNKP